MKRHRKSKCILLSVKKKANQKRLYTKKYDMPHTVDFNYLTFWERQNYEDSKKISG